MDKGMNFFYILSGPLGYVMEWIYKLLPNYGWDIILFTLLINIVKIPLQTSQQARKAAGRADEAAAGLWLQAHRRLPAHAAELFGHVRRYRRGV